MTTRTAIVYTPDHKVVSRYLPRNYDVVGTTEHTTIIEGEDRAGWTLDGYVIPRLASGLYRAEEVPTS